MTVNSIGTQARVDLQRSERRLDADVAARDAAQSAVKADNEAVTKAQQAARREFRSRNVRGSLVDVTV